jgi:putative hemolysin
LKKLKDALSVDSFPGEGLGYYRTIAGLIIFVLQRIPVTGDHIVLEGLKYEVVDMDGNRIDKVLVTQVPPAPQG